MGSIKPMRVAATFWSNWRSRFNPADLNPYYRPLLALTPALMLGLAAGSAWPGHRGPALGLALASFLGTIAALYRQRPTRFLPLILWFALGYLALQPWLTPRLADNYVGKFADGRVWTVAGVVAETPRQYGRRYRARVRVVALVKSKTDEARPVQGDLRLTWAREQGQLQRGDQIRFTGRLRRMRSFHNPGGFDYARYMAFQGLMVSAYARRHTLEVLGPAAPPGRLRTFTQGRLERAAAAVAAVGAASSRPAVGPLLETLLLGRRQGLTDEMREPYNRCGVAHLLAISGLHLGAVGGCAYLVFGLILSFVPGLRWRGWVGRTAALLALGPVLAYAILAGLPVSTQRAAVMMAVLMAAILIQRSSDAANNLALAALVVLSCHPPALFSVSFQLSFVAVSAIFYGLKQGRDWWRQGVPGPLGLRQRLRLLVLVSTLAYLGTAPLVAHYFNTLSLVALPVNLLVVPWVSFLTLPLGLLGLVLVLFALPGGDLFLMGCAHLLGAMDALVGWLGSWELAAVDTITPSGLELGLLYGLLALQPRVLGSRRARWGAALLALLLCMDAAYWTYSRFGDPRLRITAIDVGQGSSTLVELPGGKTLLIDGGGFSDNRVFDVGRRVLTPLLGRKKIRGLDLVILTHPNSDHLNGLLYLLEHFQVGEFWRNKDAPNTMGFAELRRRLKQAGIASPPFETLPRRQRWGETLLEVLHPTSDYGQAGAATADSTNDNSMVIKLTHGAHSFLWPGDLERGAESTLVARQPPEGLRASVLFAPHHGSRTSSSPAWVAAVAPREVVFSVGWQNPYRFPHPEVVARYGGLGARLWRTDLLGAINFLSDGETLTIRSTLPRVAGVSLQP
jgi:competence protein ComEC